ncbi:MAG: hypothetical protein LC781_01065 [Actinobacteria bacterium]|nr:hypothetical protein [Actinomycetota bacterium]
MSRPNLARLGGLAAVIGGMLSVVISNLSLILLSGTTPLLEAPLLALLANLAEIVSVLFFTAGLVGLYALLGRRSRLGLSGLILAFLSILASVSHIVFLITSLLFADPEDTTRWLISVQEAVPLVRGLLLGCGVLLLGVAAFRTRILGRWGVLPLLLGSLILTASLFSASVLYFGLALGPWGTILRLLPILLGLCWVLLGGVLWAYASREEARVAQITPVG